MAKLKFPGDVPRESAAYKLMVELHELRERAGEPSLIDMARGVQSTQARVYNVFQNKPSPPKRPMLLKIVKFLGTQALVKDTDDLVKQFDEWWSATRDENNDKDDDVGV